MTAGTPESNGVAVVTGGARSLGAHISRRLHHDGYRVVIADLDHQAADELARQLDPTGATARAHVTDVSDPGNVGGLLSWVVAEVGDVQVLVNNAARTQAAKLMEITPEELAGVTAVNYSGTFYACQVFGAHMSGRGYGRIVNIASLAGQNGGTATGGHYAASKGAVLAATKVFARELASTGVTVNAISPGPLDSPMVRGIVGDGLGAFEKTIPVQRLGDPDFIAEMVVLLASPRAHFVTGACWDANGGLYMR